MSTVTIGAPGSVARYLDEHRPRYPHPYCLFRYVRHSAEHPHGIALRATSPTREGAAQYVEEGDVLVDVRTYGCATMSAMCECGRHWYPGEPCATCRYVGRA